MNILAIDTASATGSVAVINGESLLAEITVARRETHSRRLMDMVDMALKMAGLALEQVDGFAFTKGPGSFTGLRIGLGAIKGLAVITGKPLVGVSALEVLAIQSMDQTRLICPMMDARNNEVYCGRYRLSNRGIVPMSDERALPPEEAVAGLEEPCLLTGDGAERYRSLFEKRLEKHARFSDTAQGIIRASTVARLSLSRFQAGQTEDVRSVTPVYLRKSYAEMNRND